LYFCGKIKKEFKGRQTMWEMPKYIFFSLLLLLFLNGCIPSNNVSGDIFQFKDSYVGDNSAVGSIIRQLPNGEHSEGFELKTKEEPFGIVLKYGDIEARMIDALLKKRLFTMQHLYLHW
jgi:hypothetical protein